MALKFAIHETVSFHVLGYDFVDRLLYALKLVMNAQLNADGTCKMADGTVKYWKPFKY